MSDDLKIALYYDREYTYDGVVVVDSDGKDVTYSLAMRGQTGAIERRRLKGLGLDPRIELLANRIWEDVRDQTIDLHYENECKVLEMAAIDFIESGKSEIDGSVQLSDGYTYDYYLSRADANKMQTERGMKLETELSNLLESFNLQDRSNSVVVFAGKTMGNEYLVSTLGKGFRTVEQLTGALAEAVAKVQDVIPESAPLKPVETVATRADVTPEANPVAEEQAPAPKPESTAKLVEGEETPEYAEEKAENEKAKIPVIRIKAGVSTVKAGAFKKKKVLEIEVDSDDIKKLKWRSVLLIQEKPLTTLLEQNVVKEFDRGDTLPFFLKFDLPLKHCPKAEKVRIYIKPDPSERVGINEAYNQYPVTVEL